MYGMEGRSLAGAFNVKGYGVTQRQELGEWSGGASKPLGTGGCDIC